MKKQYVLDTNVLLYDPQAIFKFADNDVVISIAVIEEIDRFKKELTETGRNARMVSQYIDNLRSKGPLSKGVKLEDGGTLYVDIGADITEKRIFPIPKNTAADEAILLAAIRRQKIDKDSPVIFVTKDTNLRILADALGLSAVDYDAHRVELEEMYSGWAELHLPQAELEKLKNNGEISLTKMERDYYPNQLLTVFDPAHPSMTVLGRYHQDNNRITVINPVKDLWGIKPKNREQSFAFELLMDDSIQLVTLIGKAGTGKTLLALAAGLQKTIEEGVYSRLLVSRPVYPLGKDIGFLPGDLEEKLMPWMQPIFDNIEFLMGNPDRDKLGRRRDKPYHGYNHLLSMGVLSIEPLTYIRGRSIPNQFLLVDEAQNLTPHEIKTIVTRVGYGTKIVITGDPYQIDNPYVDVASNGLTYIVERFKSEPMAGHITLNKGERSKLAELAANLL